jgi:hypothetical protein
LADHVDMSSLDALTIRPARDVDAWAITRLAALDSAKRLSGDVLLAEADGIPVAAVQIADGTAVADPFVSSAEAVAVLRMRAAQLRAPEVPRKTLLRFARPRAASG